MPIAGHEPGLCAALNLTAAELALLLGPAPGLDLASAMLTLENVSAIYRHAWLARTLELSVLELLHLIADTGIDPFAMPSIDATAPLHIPLLEFVRLVGAMGSAGVEPVQALYLLWNDDLSGVSSPDPGVVPALAAALRSSFVAVDAQFTVAANPTMDAAKALVTLVLGADATDILLGLLNETLVTSVPFAYTSPTLPAAVLTASGSRLSYDDLAKQLGFAGYLDSDDLDGDPGHRGRRCDSPGRADDSQRAESGPRRRLLRELHRHRTGSAFRVRRLCELHRSDRSRQSPVAAPHAPARARRKAKGATGLFGRHCLGGMRPKLRTHASRRRRRPPDRRERRHANGTSGPRGRRPHRPRRGRPERRVLPHRRPNRGAGHLGGHGRDSRFSPDGPETLPSPTSGSTIAGTWRGFLAAPQGGDYNVSVAAEAASAVTARDLGPTDRDDVDRGRHLRERGRDHAALRRTDRDRADGHGPHRLASGELGDGGARLAADPRSQSLFRLARRSLVGDLSPLPEGDRARRRSPTPAGRGRSACTLERAAGWGSGLARRDGRLG